MRVAAIDCGTNTIRLLIASTDDDGRLRDEVREQRFVGLGQGLDDTRQYAADAMIRAYSACDEYAELLRQYPPDKVRFVATASGRDADNWNDFAIGVRMRLGIVPEVISGEAEAELSFVGALSGLVNPVEPVLVMDSGGGSTELIRGLRDGTILESVSIPLGSRKITERFLHSDPPTEQEIWAAHRAVRRELSNVGVDLESVGTFIGVAGTVTTLAFLALGLLEYDRSKVHLSTLNAAALERIADDVLGTSRARLIERGVPEKRAEVLGGGALLVYALAERIGSATLTVSEADILDGIALALVSH
ncbi:MAG: Ppx/GppA family phosphatase [Propionibacteriaceae bacterium]|jgi:exopolyphosphatase/guanosine-5'-triphosphate,3'-diphosphate pyrophosphatase|nr:Ppx/GppA family phosphatase [Propionibacteriaceae bacterium]